MRLLLERLHRFPIAQILQRFGGAETHPQRRIAQIIGEELHGLLFLFAQFGCGHQSSPAHHLRLAVLGPALGYLQTAFVAELRKPVEGRCADHLHVGVPLQGLDQRLESLRRPGLPQRPRRLGLREVALIPLGQEPGHRLRHGLVLELAQGRDHGAARLGVLDAQALQQSVSGRRRLYAAQSPGRLGLDAPETIVEHGAFERHDAIGRARLGDCPGGPNSPDHVVVVGEAIEMHLLRQLLLDRLEDVIAGIEPHQQRLLVEGQVEAVLLLL